jgi:hypothetical protein
MQTKTRPAFPLIPPPVYSSRTQRPSLSLSLVLTSVTFYDALCHSSPGFRSVRSSCLFGLILLMNQAARIEVCPQAGQDRGKARRRRGRMATNARARDRGGSFWSRLWLRIAPNKHCE